MRRFYLDTALGQWHVTADAPADDRSRPIVMLNSRGRSLLPLMPLLAPEFYGIQIDVPGMAGQSFAPKPGVTMPQVGACVIDILDALGIDKARIFSFHTGHKIACAFASQNPDRVEKLIVAGKTHSIIPDQTWRNAVMQRYIAQRTPDTLLVSLEGKYVDQPETAIGNEAIYHANFNFNLAQAVKKITAETLIVEIVSEEEDRDPGRQGEALAALMPNARALALQQIEATGVQLYAGTQLTADVILTFMRD